MEMSVAGATVRNSGKSRGPEVVQVYVEPPPANVPRPVRELKAFTRSNARAGREQNRDAGDPRAELAYWDPGTKVGW
jgi:beta-glucosidase